VCIFSLSLVLMLHIHASGNSREHTWPSHQQRQGKTNIYIYSRVPTTQHGKTKTSNSFSNLRKESNGNGARKLATKIASKIYAQIATANKEKPRKTSVQEKQSLN
jgi:hypothetical protein